MSHLRALKGGETAAKTFEGCPLCGGQQLMSIVRIDRTPVDCGSLAANKSDAMNGAQAAIDLHGCSSCGLVFNREYDSSLISFGQQYEVSLNHSPIFSEFQNATIQRIRSHYFLKNKMVTEIGCGNGEFLQALCESADCHGVGIDPTVKTSAILLDSGKRVDFKREFFDVNCRVPLGDFVCCLSMFETVPNPGQFVRNLREMIGDAKTPVYFEVFNGERALQQGEIWSLHYEQCNYFSMASLRHCFDRNGFQVVLSDSCYGEGQYIFVEAIPKSLKDCDKDQNRESETLNEVELATSWWNGFQSRLEQRMEYWDSRLANFNAGEVFLWGSGGKSINLLNSVRNSNKISAVIDNNPKRQNRFVPGTGHAVCGPEILQLEQPKLVIISNAIYQTEITNQIRELGLNPEIEIA